MGHSEQQKEEELEYLQNFFRSADIKCGNILPGETPDFVCDILSKKIGVELVQYHPIKHNHGKCKRNTSRIREQECGNFINEYISVIKKKNKKNYHGHYDELWLLIHTAKQENSFPIINSKIYSLAYASYKFDKIYFLYNNTEIYSLYTRKNSLEIPIEEKILPMYVYVGLPNSDAPEHLRSPQISPRYQNEV